ncbi:MULTISPECIES: zinc ribbon domain-containing protein [unclassified Ruminococcus]|uniref:zinc ribbon domain-containing protein n=1 Tax=unclassified Ruminococcus TaxID=2608920 RepID=UPI001587AAE6|nr:MULTISPECIES: zinc ribbon domain-containing protein [unclassified Ruminococcus]
MFCTNCGKPLRSDMRICPYCGKVVREPVGEGRQAQRRSPQRPPQQRQRQQQAARPVQQRRPAAAPAPVKKRPQPVQQYAERKAEVSEAPVPKKKHLLPASVMRKIYRALTVAVVLTGLYISIFMIQVFRVKTATYPFKTKMKLSYSSYGQAMDAYFEDGSWSVNPFIFTCTYKGKSMHGEDYTIVFSAGTKIKVKEMVVDEKEIKKNIFEEKMLGMFI